MRYRVEYLIVCDFEENKRPFDKVLSDWAQTDWRVHTMNEAMDRALLERNVELDKPAAKD